ncbi:hypothetical protein I3842_03G094600 [Carya illinoinensis]|uniref:Uncharacterized protein n=1 Tax=Carya illinoinensis TaxID=32201 RepID=A0A922FK17_CARIL|nr:hypothetical protein I3842_03G094600 [Carya illinoinensis]
MNACLKNMQHFQVVVEILYVISTISIFFKILRFLILYILVCFGCQNRILQRTDGRIQRTGGRIQCIQNSKSMMGAL